MALDCREGEQEEQDKTLGDGQRVGYVHWGRGDGVERIRCASLWRCLTGRRRRRHCRVTLLCSSRHTSRVTAAPYTVSGSKKDQEAIDPDELEERAQSLEALAEMLRKYT